MNATIQEIEGIDDYWGPAFRSVYEGEGHDAFVQQLDDRIVQHDKEIEKLCNFHYQPKKRRRQRGSRQSIHFAKDSTEDRRRQKASEHHQCEATPRSHNSHNYDEKKQQYNLPDEVVQVYSSGDDRYGPKRRRIDPKRLGGYSNQFPVTTQRAESSNSHNIGDNDISNDVNEDTDEGSCYDGYTDGTPELDDFESSNNWEEASTFDENQKAFDYHASVNKKKQMSPSKNEADVKTAGDLRLYLRNRNRCRDAFVEGHKPVESFTSKHGIGCLQRSQLIQDHNATSDRKSGRGHGPITKLPHTYKDKDIHSNHHLDNHDNSKHQRLSRMDVLDKRRGGYNTTSRQSRCDSYKSYGKCNEHVNSSQRLPLNKHDINTSNDLRSYLRLKVTEVEDITDTSPQTCETRASYRRPKSPRSDSPNRPKSIDSDAHCSNSSQYSLSRLENVAYREDRRGSTEHYVSLTRPSKQHIYQRSHASSERGQQSHNPSTENYHSKTRHSSPDIYFEQNHPSSAEHHNQQSLHSSNYLGKNCTLSAESKISEKFHRFARLNNTQSRPSSEEDHIDESRHVSDEYYRDQNRCLSDTVHGKIKPGYTKRNNSQDRPLSADLYNDQNLCLPVEELGGTCHRMAEDNHSHRSQSIEDHISRELTGRYHRNEQPLSTERNRDLRHSRSSDLNLHENRRLFAAVQLSEISDKFDEYNHTHSRVFSPELLHQSKRFSVENDGEQNHITDLHQHVNENRHLLADYASLPDGRRHASADRQFKETHLDSAEPRHVSAECHVSDSSYALTENHYGESCLASAERHFRGPGHISSERYHVKNRLNTSADRHYTRHSHLSTERYYDSNKEVSNDRQQVKISPVSHECHCSDSKHASAERHHSDSRHASAERHYSDSRHASAERHHSDSRHASAERHYSDSKHASAERHHSNSKHASAERHHSDSRHASAKRHYSDSKHASAKRHYSDSKHASAERHHSDSKHASAERHHSDSKHASAKRHYSDIKHASAERHYSDIKHASAEHHYSESSHMPAKRRFNNSRHVSAERHCRESSHTSAERLYGDSRQVSAERPCDGSHHLPDDRDHIENHASPVGIDSGSTSEIQQNKQDAEPTQSQYSQEEHQIIFNRATSAETVIVDLGPKYNIPHRQCITPDIDVKSNHTPIDVETQISTPHPQSYDEQCSLHETNVKIESNENTANTETLKECATPLCVVKVESPINQNSLTEEVPPTVTFKHLSSPSHSIQNPDTSLDVKCEIVDSFSNNVASGPKTSTNDSINASSKSQLNYNGNKLVDAHQPSPKEHHTPTLKESQHKLTVRDVDSIILLLKDANRNPLDAVSSNNQTDACEIDQSKVSSDVPLVSTRIWFTPPKLTLESPNTQHTNSLNINNSDPRLRPRNKIGSSVEDSSGLQNEVKNNSKRKSNLKCLNEAETKHVDLDISLNPVQNSYEKLKNKLTTASLSNESSKNLVLDISQTADDCRGSSDECHKGPLSPDYENEPNCILTRQQPLRSTYFIAKAAFDLPVFDPSNKAQSISDWITKVNEVAVSRKWTDQQLIEHAMSKLVGGAKQWFEGITSQFSWEEWQNELVTAFPLKENYGKMLLDMLSTKYKVGDSLETYSFEKIALLNNCNIKGENAVECIIFGIEDESLRDKAEAENFKDPEKLLSFLRNLKKENAADTDIIYSDLEKLENP